MLVSGTGTRYDISPISTNYGGLIFSSRLEARWAVYFDYLEVGYDYEPERFDLPSRPYLPDFYISDQYSDNEFWLEIKPKFPTELEQELMAELCWETELNGMILYGGIPSPWEDCLGNGWHPSVGLIHFENRWEDEGLFCYWQDHDCFFPTFDRPFEDVKKALHSAITINF